MSYARDSRYQQQHQQYIYPPLVNDDRNREDSGYYLVANTSGEWYGRFHWSTTLAFGFFAFTVVCTMGCQVVGGINSLAGVGFLTGAITTFNIIYMVLALASYASMWFTVVTLRTQLNRRRPWQFDNEMYWVVMTYSSIILVTMVPLATYAFNIGDISDLCGATTCDVYAFMQIKQMFSFMWVTTPLSFICLAKIWFVLSTTSYVQTNITRAQYDLIASGAAGPVPK